MALIAGFLALDLDAVLDDAVLLEAALLEAVLVDAALEAAPFFDEDFAGRLAAVFDAVLADAFCFFALAASVVLPDLACDDLPEADLLEADCSCLCFLQAVEDGLLLHGSAVAACACAEKSAPAAIDRVAAAVAIARIH
nr:hypothetical protein [Bordetella ansorpii]